MGIQIVLNQPDPGRLREVEVAQVTQDTGIVIGGAPQGDLDMTPAFQRCKQHEDIGCTIALVFIVMTGRQTRLHWQGLACLGDKLIEVSSRHTGGRAGSWGRL